MFDWHSAVTRAVDELAARQDAKVDAHEFAVAWREEFFDALTKVRSGDLPRMNAGEIHGYTVDAVGGRFPALSLGDDERRTLTRTWHALQAWPDARPAIERLRRRYAVVVLTVLGYSLLLESSRRSGISWDGILSCEFLSHYKPNKQAYLEGVRLLQLEPGQCMMVAAHRWDLEGARKAGLRTTYVPRPHERGKDEAPDLTPIRDVDVNSVGFEDLANQLMA